MQQSLAYIETKGFTGAVEAADAMVKTAGVKIVKYTKIGDAYVTVLIEGSLSDCQAAIEAGSIAASKIGELISSGIIPRPMDDMALFLPFKNSKKNSSISESREKTKKNREKIDLSSIIKKSKNGITIEELSKLTRQKKDEIRPLLKKMMDEERVEKVHKKYYWIA
jgi:microcompartment protein CcmL/EutN